MNPIIRVQISVCPLFLLQPRAQPPSGTPVRPQWAISQLKVIRSLGSEGVDRPTDLQLGLAVYLRNFVQLHQGAELRIGVADVELVVEVPDLGVQP